MSFTFHNLRQEEQQCDRFGISGMEIESECISAILLSDNVKFLIYSFQFSKTR
jgi:hypothetical protein